MSMEIIKQLYDIGNLFDKVTDAHGNQLIKGVKQLFPKDAAQIAVAKVILLTTNAATADKESEVIARDLGINSDEVYQALNMQEIKTMGKRDPNAVIIVNGHVNHTLEDPELSGFKIIIRSGQTVGFYEAGSKQIGYTFTRGKDTALKRAFDQLSDKAMNSDSVGGIDLNTGSINVSRNGSGIAMKFDQAMIDRIKRQGFLGIDFRIERIVPIPNLAAILGC